MKLNKVNAGQPILPELRASTWNAFIDAAIHAKTHRDPPAKRHRRGSSEPATSIIVRNDSGADVPMFAVLGIDGPAYTPTGDENYFKFNPTLSVVEPTADHHGKFVVTAEPIADGGIGEAYISGLTLVHIDEVEGDFDWADILSTQTGQLYLKPNGTAQVLWTSTISESGSDLETQAGDKLVTQGGDTFGDHANHRWAMVRLGVGGDRSYVGITDEEIAADSSGTVSIWLDDQDSGTDVEAELDWMHGDENVSSGKQVIVTWFAQEALWRITGAECED